MNSDDALPAAGDASRKSGEALVRLRRWFDAVIDLPESERDAWLDANVTEAADREALQRLIAADTGAGFLDTPATEQIARLAAEEIAANGMIGKQVGEFRLIRALGQGGMAAVFLGERIGRDFRQHVAIKLLRRGLYSELEQRLFLRERRVLAELDHPNIARLIDGGVTDAGIPYLIMEYVDGEPITDHARVRGLDLRQKLDLFMDVCRAVEAAHRALVVHRDIKPGNILVAASGDVKLLDFGIAKLIDDDEQNANGTIGVYTPGYAAPEQLRGGLVTTATDVHGLGMLLHELLLAAKPDVRADGVTRRPSSLLDGHRRAAAESRTSDLPPRADDTLRRQLRGDLDNVLLKALDAEPARRYASAGALADDIERYLRGRPVHAHPPSRWYRTRKFVQRHRGGVGVAAVLAVAVFAALGAALWQADIARREANRARAVQEFLADLMEPLRAGQPEGKAPTLPQMLNTGIDRLDRQFTGDPGAAAELNALFARVSRQIGDMDTARRLAPRAYALSAATFGESDERTLRALHERGRVLLGSGAITDALADFERATTGMQVLGKQDFAHASALSDLGLAYGRLGRHEEALAAARQAYAVAEQAPDAPDANLGVIMNNLGAAYSRIDDWEQALVWQQHAYDWMVAHGDGEATSAAINLGNIATAKSTLGRWNDSLADLERSLALQERIQNVDPSSVWVNHVQACIVGTALNQLAQAERHCAEALDFARGKDGSESFHATTLVFRALLRVQQGNYPAARGDAREAERIYQSLEGDHSRYLARLAGAESEMMRVTGTPAQAVAALDAAVAAIDPDKAAAAPLLLAQFALACTGHSLPTCRDTDAARARALLAKPTIRQHPIRLPALAALAQWSALQGDVAGDLLRLRGALARVGPQLGADHPWVGEAQAAVALAAATAGDAELAAQARGEATYAIEALPGAHPLRARLERMLTESAKREDAPTGLP